MVTMSRRILLFLRIRQIRTQFYRSYVASRAEVDSYVENRRKALRWVEGFEQRSRKKHPTDHFAIHDALLFHIFDPTHKLHRGETELRPEYSLQALDTCRDLLRDLESYLTARNVVRCAERIANVLSYSERDVWKPRHENCLVLLTEMIALSLPRCKRSEIGTLIWSFGKWGPAALDVRVNEVDTVRDVLTQLIRRLTTDGVKGDLDNFTIGNIVNGCVQLRIQPTPELMLAMRHKLKGSVEFAEPRSLTRIVVSCSQLGLDVGSTVQARLADTLEAKILAGTYPAAELPVMLWSLGRWSKEDPKAFVNVAQSFVQQTTEWGMPQWTMHQWACLLSGCVDLRCFPDWQWLQRMMEQLKSLDSEMPGVWAMLLMSCAELSARPPSVVERCKALMATHEAMDTNVVCSMIRSFTILNVLTIDEFQTVLKLVRPQSLELSAYNQLALYQAFLHAKHFLGFQSRSHQPETSEMLKACREAWRRREQGFDKWRRSLSKATKKQLPTIEIADGDLLVLVSKADDKGVIDPVPDVFLNCEGRIAGSELWRRRLMLKFGYRVVNTSVTRLSLEEDFRKQIATFREA